MWAKLFALLYLPALLLLAASHSRVLLLVNLGGCGSAGMCKLLGAPLAMLPGDPKVGDVVLVGVVLAAGWVLAAVLLCARRGATEAERCLGGLLLLTHGLLLYGGWRSGSAMVATLNAERTISALARDVPPQYQIRRRWRPVDGGLLGSVGAVPVGSGGWGVACTAMVRLGATGLSRLGDGSKVVCMDSPLLSAKRATGDVAASARPGARPSPPCDVVSVGSNGDFAFEEAVRARLPHCKVHVFDGTMERKGFKGPPGWLAPTFHFENFGAESYKSFAGAHVAILKIDCEECASPPNAN